MSTIPRFIKFVTRPFSRQTTTLQSKCIKKTPLLSLMSSERGFCAGPPQTTEPSNSDATRGKTENLVRVRRARPADTPRILRFVREHAQYAWPGVAPPPSAAANVVLADYISRTLAQGHTLLAEQQDPGRGVRNLAGLALAAALCSWDATLLERWASCVRCQRSQSLLRFTAHCLREPRLHEKYQVEKILQVVMVVPESPKATEISLMLAKNVIKRGKEFGYPLMRFDVTDNKMAEMLKKLKLKKEWQFPLDTLKEIEKSTNMSPSGLIQVYSALGSKLAAV